MHTLVMVQMLKTVYIYNSVCKNQMNTSYTACLYHMITFQNQPTEKLVQILKKDSVHSIYLHEYLYKEQLLSEYL